MKMTCAQCGQEIVGALVTQPEPSTYGVRVTTVPEVIERHNSLCALVYPWPGTVVGEPR